MPKNVNILRIVFWIALSTVVGALLGNWLIGLAIALGVYCLAIVLLDAIK